MTDDANDEARYPTLSPEGRRMLQFLREHPHAPLYRNQSGNRLRPADIAEYRAFERTILASAPQWTPNEPPPFARAAAASCYQAVPFFRRRGALPRTFQEIEPTKRSDLSRDIAQFVPDHAPLERLINFSTSGLTGEPLLLPSHPVVAAKYLALLKKALHLKGLELRHGRGQVGVVLVGYQQPCFTYVSVTPMMEESGLAKINLHPSDWRRPEDPALYLDALNTELYTGDPIGFAALAKLPLTTRPKALISTSMTLLDAHRRSPEEHFGCPVLDVYSMNEAGTIAVAHGAGHVLLQPGLYIEILGPDGETLPAGARGEITLTGGFNPYLPLLRYRTGDYAALESVRGSVTLVGLEGRPPVMYQNSAGAWFNNINITHKLKEFPLSQFTLRQRADRSVLLQVREREIPPTNLERALVSLFGAGISVTIESGIAFPDKVVQFTSELSQSWTEGDANARSASAIRASSDPVNGT